MANHVKYTVIEIGNHKFKSRKNDFLVVSQRGFNINCQRSTDKLFIPIEVEMENIRSISYNTIANGESILFLIQKEKSIEIQKELELKVEEEFHGGLFGKFLEYRKAERVTVVMDKIPEFIKDFFAVNCLENTKLLNFLRLEDNKNDNACFEICSAMETDTKDVDNNIFSFPPGEKGAICITEEDLECLIVGNYLNDTIINFYLKFITHQMEKIHIFDTFFFEKLYPINRRRSVKRTKYVFTKDVAQQNHACLKDWTRNINILDKDFLIVPINLKKHWFLAIICYPAAKSDNWIILIFDSLRRGRPSFTALKHELLDFIICEHIANNTGIEADKIEKSLIFQLLKVPKQTNTSDCGIFLLEYVEQFLKNPTEIINNLQGDLSNWFVDDFGKQKRIYITQLIRDKASK